MEEEQIQHPAGVESPPTGPKSAITKNVHDYEVEFRVKKITREEAQFLLYDLPDHFGDLYVTYRDYDAERSVLNFTVYLNDVNSTDMSGFMDHMEQNYPNCKLQYDYMHDYTNALDDENRAEAIGALNLSQYEDFRTLPPQ